MKFFVGPNVSLAETAICLVDADGIIVAEGKVPSEPAARPSISAVRSRAGDCSRPVADL